MERFGNSVLQFSSSRRGETKTDLSTIASATVEADTCREYVVPTCLGDLSIVVPQSGTKLEAFYAALTRALLRCTLEITMPAGFDAALTKRSRAR
jgi:hypothetical protein